MGGACRPFSLPLGRLDNLLPRTMLPKPTGRSFDSPWVHVLAVRNGKIVRCEARKPPRAAAAIPGLRPS